MTAPVILAIQSADAEEKKFWNRVIIEKSQDPADLTKALEIMRKHNTIEKSLNLAREYGEKARLALAEAPDHPYRALLDNLVAYTIERES